MKIENIELTDEYIGSKVTYIPSHAHGLANHKDCKGGTISSWNDTWFGDNIVKAPYHDFHSKFLTPGNRRKRGNSQMKHTRFRIYFKSNRVLILYAFCKKEARILAQAEEIKNGNNYEIVSVTEF